MTSPRKWSPQTWRLVAVGAAVFLAGAAFGAVGKGWIGGAPTAERAYVPDPRVPARPVPTPRVPEKPPVPAPGQPPRLAIILDDWGNNFSLVQKVADLKRPVTLAVLPHLPSSRRIAEEAHRKGLAVMLHMPMQPLSASQPLEPRTILTTTPDRDVRRYLDEAIEAVPHVEGVNNHMGSKATMDERVMGLVIGRVAERNLFFVDSNTVKGSVCAAVAEGVGARFAKRDTFLDNEPTVEAVKTQLRESVRVALRKGQAVAIGHDKKATIEAIRQMIPEIEKAGVRLVFARELVQASGESDDAGV